MSSLAIMFVVTLSCVLESVLALKYSDCGNGSVIKINIPYCKSDPCVLRHGDHVQIQAAIRAPFPSKSISTSITAFWRGRKLVFPKEDDDICAGKIKPSCPMIAGKVYTYVTYYTVKKFIPTKLMEAVYEWKNENDQMVACVKMMVDVKK